MKTLHLTPREKEVMQLLNLRNQEIAERLGIKLRSVEKQIEVMIQKVGGATRTDLMLIGIAQGLIENPYVTKE